MAKNVKGKAVVPSKKSFFSSPLFKYFIIAVIFLILGVLVGKYFVTTSAHILFVEDIAHGSMVPLDGKADTYDLSVKNETEYVTYFSEAPQRKVGKMTISNYLSTWTTYFSMHHPNATLVITDENGMKHTVVGELQSAVKHEDKNRIDYTFRLLNKDELKQMHLEKTPEQKRFDKFENASLFIDAFPTALNGQITD